MRSLRSFAVCLLAACGHAPTVPPVELKHIGTPGGVSFDEACTSTGPEICGNAIDDNCNGAIDEGCGVINGKVQFEVAWTDSSASVELTLSDPQGDRVDGTHRETASGFKQDRRCPQDGCHDINVDNIVLVKESPLAGQYTVDVRLVDSGHALLPLKVHFGWRVGGRVSHTLLYLSAVDDKKEFSFEM
jgi:hypothetical protein